MKIDIVTDTFPPDINGVAMTLGRLRDGLKAKGHRVHVIHTASSFSPDESPALSLPLPGYQDVRVGLPGPFRLRKRWLKRRPDAIYVATQSPLGDSAVRTAKTLGIPVATGFHTNFDQYLQDYSLSSLQPAARSYLKKFHERANSTLAPSAEVANQLRQYGIPNVHILGRGVDTDLFTPTRRSESLRQSWNATPQSPVAILVGRIAPEKNLPFALNILRQARLQEPSLIGVIVGDGPLREKLTAEFPEFHFVGAKRDEELATHYASADIQLFPSETETFGNVLLEGLASALVTISYDYAASASHIKHGLNGLKATKGNPQQFTDLFQQALQHAGSSQLRTHARQSALSLGWPQIINQFEQHLMHLTQQQSKSPQTNPTNNTPQKLSCRTVFLSDVHLGTPDSKSREVVHFLKHIQCEKLVLNGDIIDGWALKRGSRWRSRDSRFIRKVLKMMEKDVEVIYLRGNHDDILERFLPLMFGKLQLVKEHIHTTQNDKRYLVIHGDGFDSVSTNHRWLAMIGAVAYDLLLSLNRFYNKWRAWRGLEYFSLSKKIKAKVKSAVSFVDRYEQQLQELARYRKCDGIICGHIHTPENKQVGEIHYLNSGDWVESLTAILEHHNGTFELVQYENFIKSRVPENQTSNDQAIPLDEKKIKKSQSYACA